MNLDNVLAVEREITLQTVTAENILAAVNSPNPLPGLTLDRVAVTFEFLEVMLPSVLNEGRQKFFAACLKSREAFVFPIQGTRWLVCKDAWEDFTNRRNFHDKTKSMRLRYLLNPESYTPLLEDDEELRYSQFGGRAWSAHSLSNHYIRDNDHNPFAPEPK